MSKIIHVALDFTEDEIEAVKKGLRFALDFNSDYFVFAPRNDYNDGHYRKNERLAQAAASALEKLRG